MSAWEFWWERSLSAVSSFSAQRAEIRKTDPGCASRISLFYNQTVDRLSRFFGKIDRVMQTAALLSLQSRFDNQMRDLNQVSQFKKLWIDRKIPIILLNFRLQVFDSRTGAKEAFGRSDDSDIIPHRQPKFVPVVRKNDSLIRIISAMIDPVGNLRR